jgi:hypothetical protein
MPSDLRVPICTLVYAAPRLDVKELKQVDFSSSLSLSLIFLFDDNLCVLNTQYDS